MRKDNKQTNYKLLDLLWIKMEKESKLMLLPLIYKYDENNFLDILNNCEYKFKMLKDEREDDCINGYLIPLDVFNELSKIGKIKEVLTTSEMEFLVNGYVDFGRDTNERQLKKKGSLKKDFVSYKELSKMTKEYLKELERIESKKVLIHNEEDLEM